MELFEVSQKELLAREAAAQRLHALADSLAQHNDVEFERSGMQFKVRVPDQFHLQVEFEDGDEETELEIELTW